MLHIICPYSKHRENIYKDFIFHYKSFYPESNIYIVEQDDDKPFRKGQLINLIFKELTKTNGLSGTILLADIDMRLFDKIDFEGILTKHNKVTIPYDNIVIYTMSSIGQYADRGTRSNFQKGDKIAGGLVLFTKEIFERCGGFSNLYCGWGYEDSEFLRRNGDIGREKNTIMHLHHPRIKQGVLIKRNERIYARNISDTLNDGFRQTICENMSIEKIEDNVSHYKFRGIDAINRFKYRHILGHFL